MEGFPSASFLLSVVNFFRNDRRKFPPIVEAFISWLAALFLAIYLGIGYVFATRTNWKPFANSEGDETCWNIPLTTITRSTGDDAASILDDLDALLESLQQKRGKNSSENLREDQLASLMQTSVEARRLASIAMLRLKQTKGNDLKRSHGKLVSQLINIWNELLNLPIIHNREYAFELSLIVPAYNEDGRKIQSKLLHALQSCHQSETVQLVLVDAGRNTDIKRAIRTYAGENKKWGDVKLVTFTAGGGRGPCLNFGAKMAGGRILTFLHSDNILPDDWDQKVKTSLLESKPGTKPIACAFSFKIDISREALEGEACAPGLHAAQWLGTVRTKYFRVLYGDSVLSLPTSYFHYIGGYPPNQALMEDYELMDLLRKRVSRLREERVLIDTSETLISPRRWQQHGVAYVTLFNCLCVFLYQHRGWSPQMLYQFYYQRPTNTAT
jgi:hypothetical protein